jgi:hypothetical protein
MLKRRRWVLVLPLGLLALGIAVIALISRSFTFTPDAPTPQTVRCTTQPLTTEFVSVEDGFAAAFPCAPMRSTSSANTPFGKISIIRYEAEADGVNYAVSFVDYAMLVPSGELPGLLVSFILDGAKRGVLRDSGMENPVYAPISLGDYAGESIRAANAEKVLQARVYIVGNATYQIVIVTPKSVDAALPDTFLGSFRVSQRAIATPPPAN